MDAETDIALSDLRRRIEEQGAAAARSGLGSVGHNRTHGNEDHLVINTIEVYESGVLVGSTPAGGVGTIEVYEGGVLVGDTNLSTFALDFGAGFDVTESPADEFNIVLDLSEVAAGGELGGTMDAPTVDTTHSGSAHHAQAHGASDHTDRTRLLWIPAEAFGALEGSPALTNYGTAPDSYRGWALDSATDESIVATIPIPYDYESGKKIWLFWTNAGAGAGNVRFDVVGYSCPDGTALTTSGTTASSTVAAPAQDVLDNQASGTLSLGTWLGGRLLRLVIRRDANNAADTLANDCVLLGAALEYTADM